LIKEKVIRNKTACIRPEDVRAVSANLAHFMAKVVSTRFYGSHKEINVRYGKQYLTLQHNSKARLPEKGAEIGIRLQLGKIFWI
jgi:ABC-type Fe3+/spermidine/putrescine transport system ATPase subunit